MHRVGRWLLSLAVVGLILPLGACASAQRPIQAQGQAGEATSSRPASAKYLTAGILGQVPTFYQLLNPAGVRGGDALEQLVNAGLTQIDGQGNLAPQLAEFVPTLENGGWTLQPDGRMEITWKLKPSAHWHDGIPFTSDDLAFTTTVWFDDDLPVFRNPAHAYIDTVLTPDPQTVTVTWKQPYIKADAFFNTPALPRHLLERVYVERKASLLDSPYWTSEFVGTGPYRVKDWETGTYALLQYNEQYVLGAPKIGEIEVKFFVDPNTLMANILAGTVLVTIGRSVTLDQGLDLREHWRDGVVETRAAGWYVVYPQMLNPTPALVLDARLRHALWHGIDRGALVETFHGGLSTVADIVVGMDEPEYREVEPFIVRHPYDPRRSAQLLEELGYRRGADGALRDANGDRLALETTSTFDDMNSKLHFAIADYWRQLGLVIETTIIPVQRVQDQQLRATYPSFEVIGQPHGIEQVQRLHSSQARTPERNYTGSNNARYMDPTMDRLIEGYLTTIPRAERAQIAGQIVRQMTGEALWMGLFYRGEPTMIANSLVNVGVGPTRSTQAWNVHLWDVR